MANETPERDRDLRRGGLERPGRDTARAQRGGIGAAWLVAGLLVLLLIIGGLFVIGPWWGYDNEVGVADTTVEAPVVDPDPEIAQ